MIAHLSSEEFSECILGQPSPLIAQHIDGCPACRAELTNFREALAEFRGAVHTWSEDQAAQYQANATSTVPASDPESRPWTASQQLAWALLIAVVCILASFVVPWREGDNIGGDAVLLKQVDAQVSRTVPSSMEPLMKLVVQE
jgi:anti-sigma factor RsiW